MRYWLYFYNCNHFAFACFSLALSVSLSLFPGPFLPFILFLLLATPAPPPGPPSPPPPHYLAFALYVLSFFLFILVIILFFFPSLFVHYSLSPSISFHFPSNHPFSNFVVVLLSVWPSLSTICWVLDGSMLALRRWQWHTAFHTVV